MNPIMENSFTKSVGNRTFVILHTLLPYHRPRRAADFVGPTKKVIRDQTHWLLPAKCAKIDFSARSHYLFPNWLTIILYGIFESLWFEVDGLSEAPPGGPTGELSSKISPETRNLIGSPISIYKSCLSPSSSGYSHTHACSVSSKREGCCNAVGGINMSSKNPNVTAYHREKIRLIDFFVSFCVLGNRLLFAYCELLRGYNYGFYRWLYHHFEVGKRYIGRALLCAMHRPPAEWSNRRCGLFPSMRYTIRHSEVPAKTISIKGVSVLSSHHQLFSPYLPIFGLFRLWQHQSISNWTFPAVYESCLWVQPV